MLTHRRLRANVNCDKINNKTCYVRRLCFMIPTLPRPSVYFRECPNFWIVRSKALIAPGAQNLGPFKPYWETFCRLRQSLAHRD